MPIFGRTNYIITASGVVTLCKRLYSMPDESKYDYSFAYFSVPSDQVTNDKSIIPENCPSVPRTYLKGNDLRNNLQRLRDDV